MRQVVHQTRGRLISGNTHVPGKIVSLFEPHTEVIRKGKAAKPTEFGIADNLINLGHPLAPTPQP